MKAATNATSNKQIKEVQEHYLEKKNRVDPRIGSSEYDEYRRMWSEYPEKEIVAPLPINLDLHITNVCNLKCSFCPRTWKELSREHENKLKFMDFELFKNIIDEAVTGGVKAIHFTGNGEPLLHKGLEDMIAYCHKMGVLEILMHTNATLLNEKRGLSLLKAGVHDLAISFDSPVKETYEKLRVGADFEETINNIKKFVINRDTLGYQYPLVRLQMVNQQANFLECEMFDDMFSKIADSVSHANFISFNGGPQSETYGISKELINEDSMLYGNRRLNKKFKCKYLWQRFIIEVDGEIYPCFYNDKLQLGNVNQQSLREVWNGPRMQEMRKIHARGEFMDILECANCGRQYEVCDNDG